MPFVFTSRGPRIVPPECTVCRFFRAEPGLGECFFCRTGQTPESPARN